MKLFRIVLLLLLISFYLTGYSQNLEMPEEVKVGYLKNGMTYFLISDGNPGKVKLTMLTKVGAFLERPDQHGYAHMVEHMLFKGSKNYPGKACAEELELMGMRRGIDSNGYTGSKSTQYFVTIPENDKDYFERSLGLLRDWMFYLEMDEEVLENEKKVITEEINRAGGDPIGIPNLIGTSLEGHDPLGTKASVQSATSKGLFEFYKDNYIPSNMALVVQGEMDQEWAVKQIKKVFSKETAAEGHHPNQYIDINHSTIVSGNYPRKNNIDPDIFAVLFKDEPIEVTDYTSFKENLSRKLLTEMLDRRLTQLMNNSVKRVSMNIGSVVPGNASYIIRIELSKEVSYEKVFTSFCKVLAQVQQHGFTPEEIEFVNAMERLYLERRRSVSSDIGSSVQNYFISGDMPVEPEQYEDFTHKALDELTCEDYQDLFNHMVNLEKTILYDRTSKACSPSFNETAILGQLEHLDTISTRAFVFEGKVPMSKKAQQSLSFEIDTRHYAVITKEKQLDDDLKVLSYPSGVRVVLYNSSDNKANVKLLSSKGLSSIPSDARTSFSNSLRYMLMSYGKYDAKEARTIERSWGISKRASIDDYSYELNVNGESGSMEEMLKCFNLLITEPEYPETKEVLKGLERRNKRVGDVDEDDENNTKVEAELNDALVKRLYTYDSHIKEAIGEAIILVQGRLPENIEVLVSQYIGSIPSAKSSEALQIDNDGIIPDSIINTNLTWGKDLSKMAWYFRKASKKELTLHDELVLRGATEYAHLKMFSIIREKYGIVYATGKNAEIYKVPFDYSTLRLAFMTDTANMERAYEIMTNEVFAPLSKIELTKTEVQKTKALVRSLYVMSFYEDKRISDEWLKAYLKYSKVYSVKELDAMINAITSKALEDCLHSMIDVKRFELRTHLPDKAN